MRKKSFQNKSGNAAFEVARAKSHRQQRTEVHESAGGHHRGKRTDPLERLRLQADPVKMAGHPERDAGQQKHGAKQFDEEQQPAVLRRINAAPAQSPEEKARIQARSQADGVDLDRVEVPVRQVGDVGDEVEQCCCCPMLLS